MTPQHDTPLFRLPTPVLQLALVPTVWLAVLGFGLACGAAAVNSLWAGAVTDGLIGLAGCAAFSFGPVVYLRNNLWFRFLRVERAGERLRLVGLFDRTLAVVDRRVPPRLVTVRRNQERLNRYRSWVEFEAAGRSVRSLELPTSEIEAEFAQLEANLRNF
jgi:hypothetical protein